ncbi:MAG: PorT family protein [Bacteroidales bacterium]|nr:PorT family protein [Bacteroidales bacterium]
MKKILILIVAGTFIFITSNAQIFQYGIKAGVNFSSLPMDDITVTTPTETYDLVTGESATGYQAGLMTRIKIAMVFVQPELYFNFSGGSVKKVLESGGEEYMDIRFNRIDIPLLAGVKFGPARINIGPVGSVVISSTNELTEISQSLETLHEGLTWGFQAGIGLDLFKKLTIDARYEGSLSKYGDAFTIDNTDYNFDARPRQWIFAVGWWF